MNLGKEYTVALNTLITCGIFKAEKITANVIVDKTGSDGTTVRAVMFKLKNAGLISHKTGPRGTRLVKDLHEISLFDVYRAVSDPDASILRLYEGDDKDVSLEINATINAQFDQYKNLLFKEMKKTSVADLCDRIQMKIKMGEDAVTA